MPLVPVARLERYAPLGAVLYTVVALVVAVGFHPTPLYFVETDLVGEYIPAATSLASGRLAVEHFGYKGPGYPLVLAVAGTLAGSDFYLGARVLSAIAAGTSVWLGFLLIRSFAPAAVALFVLGGLIANPTLLRYGVEAGTDAPTLAVALGVTILVLRGRTMGALLAAGALAGFATLMRGNAAFLLPAAAVVLCARPRRWRILAAFTAGATVPLAAWVGATLSATGRLPQDLNYMNVAYELYGRTVPWDQFATRSGSRFHSMWSVLAFDPLLAASRIGWNVVAHRLRDLADLVPVWIGVLAVPGLVFMARDRAARPALLFASLCALTLAAVFYSSRFSLYLLPIELAAAGYALAWCARRFEGAAQRAWRLVPASVGVALLVGSSVEAGRSVHRFLAEAPHEVREAGGWLAAHVPSGARIMARKPHVAWYARLRHVPFPAGGVPELLTRAGEERAAFLFYSPIELLQRPECAVLSDSGVALPGLEQVAYRSWGDWRFYAVYRLTGECVDRKTFDGALEAALVRYANKSPDRPDIQLFVAAQFVTMGRHRQALQLLEPLARAGARGAAVVSLLSSAYLGVGDLERASAACEEAIRLGPESAWQHERLGTIRHAQGRVSEARRHFERAVSLEPGNPEHQVELGLVCAESGDYAAAADAFDRGLRLAPADLRLRRYAIGAHQKAGHERRALEILREGERSGLPINLMLDPASADAGAGNPRR